MMQANESRVFTQRIVADTVIEVCVGQWWSHSLPSEVDVSIDFHPLDVSQQTVALSSGGSAARVMFDNTFAPFTMKPSGKLETLRKSLRPTQHAIICKSGSENTMFNGKQTHALELTYELNLAEKAKVVPRLAQLSEVLYESAAESQLMVILNEKKFPVLFADAFGRYSTELDKGKYTLRAEIRHDDTAWLEKYKDLALNLDIKIKAVDVAVDKTPAIVQGGSVHMRLPTQQRTSFFVEPPTDASLPKLAEAGDVLLGKLSLLPSSHEASKSVYANLVCTVAPRSKKTTDDSASLPKPKPTEEDSVVADKRKALLLLPVEHLEVVKDLETEFEKDQAYLTQRLEKLGAVTDKNRDYAESVADRLLALLDEDAIAAGAGRLSIDPTTPEEASAAKKQADAKASLIAALRKKLEAVLFDATTNGKTDRIAEAEAVRTRLQGWVKLSDKEQMAAEVAFFQAKEQHGRLLERLLQEGKTKWSKEQADSAQKAAAALGWDTLQASLQVPVPIERLIMS